MKQFFKRIISLILAMAMSLSLLSANVWAAEVLPQEAETSTEEVGSLVDTSLSAQSAEEDSSAPVEKEVEEQTGNESASVPEPTEEIEAEPEQEPEEQIQEAEQEAEEAENNEDEEKEKEPTEKGSSKKGRRDDDSLTTQEVVASGTCGTQGDNVTWMLDEEGTLIIGGSGEMENYKNSYPSEDAAAPWFVMRESIQSIIIKNGVTSIGDYAFEEIGLYSIEIPESVTSIGDGVFYECHGLYSITLPDGVTSIGDYLFFDCTNLTSVILPDNVTSIGENSFGECRSLSSIAIPNGVTSIGSEAFRGCSSLTCVSIPDGVTRIEYGVFSFCENLSLVTIPDSVTSIGDEAFGNCRSLCNITIPDRVTNIGGAFSYCTSLKSITIPNGVTSIGDYAFCWCSNLCCITIPDSVTSIGDGAFSECGSLSSIAIPDSVTSLGNFVFSGCNVSNIRIPYGVTSIGVRMFAYCSNLTNVTIPNSVTIIGNGAFEGCSRLSSITIPDGVTRIETDTFSECGSLSSITIPNGVTSIGYWAFDNCASMTRITIPNSMISIDNHAFYRCSSLNDVYYIGTEDEWSNISINSYNECLTNATIHYNSTGPVSTLGNTDVDDYIIDQVSRYTRAGAYDEFDRIMNANYDSKESFRRICELTQNLNITDPVEGVRYLGDRDGYKWDYNYLINDNAYCANNYFDWMHNTKKGKAARVALVGSGLIYNYELASYINPFTYLNEDTPGVKRKRELLKTVVEDITGVESNDGVTASSVISNAKKVGKLAKNMIKINNLTDEAVLDDLTTRIINCKDDKQLEKLQGQFAELLVSKCNTVGSDAIYCDVEMTSKALGYGMPILSFVGATAGDIEEILNLEKDIENYEACKRFLLNVYNDSSISLSMRTAAYQLLDDIDNGYYNKVKSVLLDVMEFGNDMIYMDKSMLVTYLEAHGMSTAGVSLFGDIMATLTLGTFVSNIVIDMGDYVRQIYKTEGYNELASMYSRRLQQDKETFLANQNAENAWQFFEDYTMLWNLRYRGEEQYLKMNKIKVFIFDTVKDYDYELKEEVVRGTLEYLDGCKFAFASDKKIPESVQYAKKSVIKCPVDVEVFTANGKLIAELKDGVPSDTTNEYGRFVVIYDAYSGEYIKVICQNSSAQLNVKMKAVSSGLVDYQTASADTPEIQAFDKVSVKKDAVISVGTDSYAIDSNGDGIEEENCSLVQKDGNQYTPVESLSVDETEISVEAGNAVVINVHVLPDNSTNTSVQWVSLNDEIAAVKNGTIEGVSEGETTVIAKAVDAQEIEQEIKVTVLPPPSIPVTGITASNTDISLAAGESNTLQYTIAPENATNQNVTWYSLDETIATVTEAGLVTGVSEGVTTVTATTEDGEYQVQYTVNVVGDVIPTFAAYTTDGTASIGDITAPSESFHTGDTVTVTAPAVEGYSFLGWYEVTSTENGLVTGYGDKNLCTSLQYSFELTGDTAVVAVYNARGSATVTIQSINGAKYTVGNSATVQSGSTETAKLGTTLTVTARDGEQVLQWLNESDKVIGKGEVLSIPVTGNMTIKLVYKSDTEQQSFVQFVSDYDQVLSYKQYSAADIVAFPDAPTKYGYEFNSWVFEGTTDAATAESIKERIGTENLITLKPSYTRKEVQYTVTVNYEGVTREADTYPNLEVGSGYSVYAPKAEGYTFQYWKRGDTIAGYKPEYFLQVDGNINMTAVYGTDAAEAKPVITLDAPYAVTAGDVHKVACSATRSIPEGYTLVEHGILYARDVDGLTEETFVEGTTGVGKYISTGKQSNGVVKLNVKVATDEVVVSFRGYMTLKNNETGNTETIYSEIQAANYGSLMIND